jgi:hypothetical protein
MRIVRDIDSEVITEVERQHTQPIHLVRLELPGQVLYLSENRAVVFGGNVYDEGRVRVSSLQWGGDGSQSCVLEILNEDNFAASLVLNNQIADAVVTIWTTYLKPDGTNSAPVLYAYGTCDDTELDYDAARITVVTSRYKTSFLPNYYAQTAGFNHLPPEGGIVAWNSTTYVLERDLG